MHKGFERSDPKKFLMIADRRDEAAKRAKRLEAGEKVNLNSIKRLVDFAVELNSYNDLRFLRHEAKNLHRACVHKSKEGDRSRELKTNIEGLRAIIGRIDSKMRALR